MDSNTKIPGSTPHIDTVKTIPPSLYYYTPILSTKEHARWKKNLNEIYLHCKTHTETRVVNEKNSLQIKTSKQVFGSRIFAVSDLEIAF